MGFGQWIHEFQGREIFVLMEERCLHVHFYFLSICYEFNEPT